MSNNMISLLIFWLYIKIWMEFGFVRIEGELIKFVYIKSMKYYHYLTST